MTRVYDHRTFYQKKKAQYTAFFMIILVVYMFPAIFLEIITINMSFEKIIAYIIYNGFIALLFLFLKKGFIHFVTNALLIAGLIKAVEYFLVPMAFVLYIHVALGLLMSAAIHVYKYQLYLGYFLFNLPLLIRPFYIRQFIEEGILDNIAMNQSIQAIFGALFVTFTVHFLTGIIDSEIEETIKLENMASTDTLTGLSNRRKMEAFFEKSKKTGRKILFVVDIDFFKKVNDEFGHDIGDSVLKRFAGILQSVLRDSDTCYRWGGEEFVAILQGIDLPAAEIVAERMRVKVQAFDFGLGRSITISIGITDDRGKEELDVMLKRADRALYNAKEKGRNRVEII